MMDQELSYDPAKADLAVERSACTIEIPKTQNIDQTLLPEGGGLEVCPAASTIHFF
jgi:hypothetical protein